jgi:hypothetical protein
MKKLFFIGIILLSSNFCSAQLISGSLLDEGRKMTSHRLILKSKENIPDINFLN